MSKSAIEITDGVRAGTLSPVAVTEESLARIEATDKGLKAWVIVDTERAREQAKAVEATPAASRGILAGVPVGIKDIFDVAGLTTGLGADFAAFLPQEDSVAVRKLREAGAVIVGKTETTQFAMGDPAPTVNPWNPQHTPGGSSSGSAAAVAAGQVPIALGSQTVGSVLRPAAYCGCVGLKPTHGRISTVGVFPLAYSYDHVGIFSRSVAEAALVLGVLAGYDQGDLYTQDIPVDDYLAAARSPRAPVLLVPRRFYHTGADAEIAGHIDAIADKLAAAGATVREIDLPAEPEDFVATGRVIQHSDAAAAHQVIFERFGDRYRPIIGDSVATGLRTSAVQYIKARSHVNYIRRALTDFLKEGDAILMPSAPSTAPLGLGSTGNAVFCAPASFTGLPSIGQPSGIGASGLPLAVQLIGAPWQEAKLMSTAAWVEQQLGFDLSPPLS